MEWLAFAFGVLFLGAGYLAYYFRKEGRRLYGAIEDHWKIKNAPWATPEIRTDQADRFLWDEIGLEELEVERDEG